MPYTATTWNSGDSANATKLNNLETQYTEATLSYNPDLFTSGFVLTGYLATGTVGTTTVNVAAGTAYLLQADGTTRQRKLSLSTQTTATPSTTYHLYLQPDGTWYWNTLNTPAANSLAIANVTTNVSGQIATITDLRGLAATLLPSMAGVLTVPPLKWAAVAGSGFPVIFDIAPTDGGQKRWQILYNGTDKSLEFFDQTDTINALELTPTGINTGKGFTNLAGQATAGSFGVPPIVAQAIRTNVVNSSDTTLLTWTSPNDGNKHTICVHGRFFIGAANTNNGVISFNVQGTDPDTGAGTFAFVQYIGATAISASAITKGSAIRCASLTLEVSPNTAVTAHYQDNVAGTISDFATVIVKLLS